MKKTKLVQSVSIAVLLAIAAAANADRLPATKTFEAKLATIRMPSSDNGTLTLRECNRCDYQTIRVTPATQYKLNNQSMTLDKFRGVMEDLKRSGKRTINVKRDEATNTVAVVFVNVRQ